MGRMGLRLCQGLHSIKGDRPCGVDAHSRSARKALTVMSIWSLLLIAVGVSADAFAVALGKGLHMRKFNYRYAFIVAGAFGVFQAVMPLVGWLLGTRFADYITEVDHWIAFGLLAGVGGKMLWEAFSSHEDDEQDT